MTNANLKGKVFYSTWGYEQTNVYFYQVVETRGKSTVVLREVKSNYHTTGGMRGEVTPDLNNFKSDNLIVRRLKNSFEVPAVKIDSVAYARLMADTTESKCVTSYA